MEFKFVNNKLDTSYVTLWAIPAVKTGVIRFAGGVAGSIFNNF